MSLGRSQEAFEKLGVRRETHRLEFYTPYPFQQRFHAARTPAGEPAMQRLLMAGNRVGKTECGAFETAMHATGDYPDWWVGHRLDKPKKIWCGGANNDKVRDICQAKLFGDPADPTALGTGAIPKDRIVRTVRKPGIPDAFDIVLVKHRQGHNVIIAFKSYVAEITDWMGEGVDLLWFDEEPDEIIYSQGLARTIDTAGIAYMTFTPEKGKTKVVTEFMQPELKPGQALYRAGWDDAPHLTPEAQAQLEGVFLVHEVEMRKRGDPVLGEGMVFPIAPESIMCDPFPIPYFYKHLCGMDFGWDHPTANVWIAHNPESDIVYVYDCYRKSKEVPVIHAEAIKTRGAWIPVVWPHDGYVKDKGTGVALAKQYRDLGVNLLAQHFTNPPDPSGKLNFSVEPGIEEMLTRMITGRLKVFSTLKIWFDEMRGYYRKDNQIVKFNDDLMSGTRYAVQSLRFAAVFVEKLQAEAFAVGTHDYDPLEAN